jgi:hypothetical protein
MRSIQFGVLLALVVACGTAHGQHREFAFGMGYGHLFLDGHNSDALEEQGGFRLLGRVSWPVSEPMTERAPEVRFGLGLGLSFYISEQDSDVDAQGPFAIFEPNNFTALTAIEPEIQFSLRQPVARDYYLEPGIAGVFTVGNYLRGEEVLGSVDVDTNRWRVGGGGRLFLRGAYHRERYSFGIEGSYSYGWLDFGDDIGGDIQQGYLGLFYAQRF